MTVFEQKVNSLLKFVKKVSPQIAISESTKSGREKTDFFTIHTISNFMFTTEQKTD